MAGLIQLVENLFRVDIIFWKRNLPPEWKTEFDLSFHPVSLSDAAKILYKFQRRQPCSHMSQSLKVKAPPPLNSQSIDRIYWQFMNFPNCVF